MSALRIPLLTVLFLGSLCATGCGAAEPEQDTDADDSAIQAGGRSWSPFKEGLYRTDGGLLLVADNGNYQTFWIATDFVMTARVYPAREGKYTIQSHGFEGEVIPHGDAIEIKAAALSGVFERSPLAELQGTFRQRGGRSGSLVVHEVSPGGHPGVRYTLSTGTQTYEGTATCDGFMCRTSFDDCPAVLIMHRDKGGYWWGAGPDAPDPRAPGAPGCADVEELLLH